MKIDNANGTNVFSYYKNFKNLNIPLFQRPYIWDKNKAEDVIKELLDFYDDNQMNNIDNIYFGNVFLHRNGFEYYDIIDGQQRTVFFKILTKVFINEINLISIELNGELDLYKKNHRSEDSDPMQIMEIGKIEEKIYNFNRRKSEFNNGSIKTSEGYVDDLIDDSNEKNLFNKQYKIIKSIIKNERVKRGKEYIIDFFNFIIDKMNIMIHIDDENDDINDIFRTINSAGKSLNYWDLMRNEIFKLNSDKLDNIDQIMKMKEYSFDKSILPITKALIIEKTNKLVAEKELFNQFKKYIDENKDENLEIIDYIEGSRNIFEIKNDDENFRYILLLKIIKNMKLKQIETIYWWATLNKEDFNKNKSEIAIFLAKLMLVFVFIVNLGNERANLFERVFKDDGFFQFVKDKKFNFEEIFEDSRFDLIRNLYYKKGEEIQERRSKGIEYDNIYEKNKQNQSYLILMFFYESFGNPENKKSNTNKIYNDFTKIFDNKSSKNKYNNIEYLVPEKYYQDDKIKNEYLKNLGNLIFLNDTNNKILLNKNWEEKKISIKNENPFIEDNGTNAWEIMYKGLLSVADFNKEIIEKRTSNIIDYNLKKINEFIKS